MDDERERLRIENIFGAMSLALVDKMQQAFATEAGLGPSAAAAIIQVGTAPGLSIEQLRRILALSHSATVRLVDQLCAGGLVERGEAGDGDRRAKPLHLTEAGQAAFGRCVRSRRAVIERAVGKLDSEETRMLAGLVEKLLPALVDPGDDGDVVCRVCDETICTAERCPITHIQT